SAWFGAARSLVDGEQYGSVGGCRLLEEVPQMREPAPGVFEVAVRQLPVTLGVGGVVAATELVAVHGLCGRRHLFDLLRAEEVHYVVVALVQVVAAEDALVKRRPAPLELTVGEAAVDGVPRLVCLLHPFFVPALAVRTLLDLFDKGEQPVV